MAEPGIQIRGDRSRPNQQGAQDDLHEKIFEGRRSESGPALQSAVSLAAYLRPDSPTLCN
jgi:hypothetical protein